MIFPQDIVLMLLMSLPVWVLVVVFIVALGKKPGLRRRQEDPNYPGPERRCPYRKDCKEYHHCHRTFPKCPDTGDD